MSATRNGERTTNHSSESTSVELAGGCACGAIRYECSTEPVFSFNCHCYECQRVGGSAFTSLMIVPKSDFQFTRGEPRYYASPADSGYFLNRGFCTNCGSPVVATEDHRPQIVLIHAGSLDDPGKFVPAADIFATRAQHWDYMNPELPKIPDMPPLPDTEMFRIQQT